MQLHHFRIIHVCAVKYVTTRGSAKILSGGGGGATAKIPHPYGENAPHMERKQSHREKSYPMDIFIIIIIFITILSTHDES